MRLRAEAARRAVGIEVVIVELADQLPAAMDSTRSTPGFVATGQIGQRHRQAGNHTTEPTDVDPAAVQTVVETAMAALVLGSQRQLDQRLDRALGAQHRIGQLEQRIGPGSQAAVEASPERVEIIQRAVSAVASRRA